MIVTGRRIEFMVVVEERVGVNRLLKEVIIYIYKERCILGDVSTVDKQK